MNAETPNGSRLTRREQKERTRAALLDAALRLLEHRSFDSLGLREVAREAGIVPTAFYRHFDSMEALELALIDDSFRTLHTLIRVARAEATRPEDQTAISVDALVRHVHDHRPHFRVIVRERCGGVPAVRQAIRAEIRLFSSELATDLARFPAFDHWSTDDLGVFASLIVDTMVATVEAIVDTPADARTAEREIVRTAKLQLRLIALAVPAWRSAAGPPDDAS